MNLPPARLKLLAWLAGDGAAVCLVLAIALFAVAGSALLGAVVFALAGMLAVVCWLLLQSLPETEREPAPTVESPAATQEPESGLPVHPNTGLYHWWVFRERATEEIGRALRHKRELAILLLEPGDLLDSQTPEAQAQAAKTLREAVRATDFAGQVDEQRFVVMLPETDGSGAKTAGRRLLATLRDTGERWRGALVVYPRDGDNPDTLIDEAKMILKPGRLESAMHES